MFLEGLQNFLFNRNLFLDLNEPRLTGNIKNISSGKTVDQQVMNGLMPEFFSKETENLELVPDVKKVLERLSKRLQIVVLTNIPQKDKNKRENALKNNGMGYPVITNSGPKGEAVKEIINGIEAKSFFIDDMPLNIDSVSKECPETFCIHFVQDSRLKELMQTPKSAKIKAINWIEVENYILKSLKKVG